jgi:hypothetical protein
MSRPLTRAQALENRAFLKLLSRTGNVRLACRELRLKYGTMQDRRRKHPAFAVKWDAAVVFAQARLAGPSTSSAGAAARGTATQQSRTAAPHRFAAGRNEAFRTRGGEAVVVRLKNGALQMRRAQPGKLTPAAEQAFLAALSATCNVTLAAAAVGACFGAFNRRRRKDPAFAREMRLALQRGYEALELALLEAGVAGSHEHADWRSNDPPATPPMTVNQALQLMYLHQKEARLIAEPDWLKRRPKESWEAHGERLALMAEERDRRAREAFEIAEAERWERGLPPWGPAGEAVRHELGLEEGSGPTPTPPRKERGCLGLPDLSQVTGWSRADPDKAPHHDGVALFGGWRIEDIDEAQ